jgi:hypothetical protein
MRLNSCFDCWFCNNRKCEQLFAEHTLDIRMQNQTIRDLI